MRHKSEFCGFRKLSVSSSGCAEAPHHGTDDRIHLQYHHELLREALLPEKQLKAREKVTASRVSGSFIRHHHRHNHTYNVYSGARDSLGIRSAV